jgi:hypothetical protein
VDVDGCGSGDQSEAGAWNRVHHHWGDVDPSLLGLRLRLINVWRPINRPVEDYPLAVCDGASVPPGALIPADYVRTTYTGENLLPVFSDKYKWYYMSRQTPDDVLLFKCYDSSSEVKARCKSHATLEMFRVASDPLCSGCPHAAFRIGDAADGGPGRESIEVKAIVFSRT